MAADARYRMSQERYDQLKEELERMQTVEAKEISEQIKEARSFGDLSENSEYDEAKNAQGKLYSKIQEYKDLLENAIITENGSSGGGVGMGSAVTVKEVGADEEETFQIVGSQEANPMQGRISEESPLGRALMSKKAGESVSYEVNGTVFHFEIITVEN